MLSILLRTLCLPGNLVDVHWQRNPTKMDPSFHNKIFWFLFKNYLINYWAHNTHFYCNLISGYNPGWKFGKMVLEKWGKTLNILQKVLKYINWKCYCSGHILFTSVWVICWYMLSVLKRSIKLASVAFCQWCLLVQQG